MLEQSHVGEFKRRVAEQSEERAKLKTVRPFRGSGAIHEDDDAGKVQDVENDAWSDTWG